MSKLLGVLSTEGNVDGKRSKELEYTFYGKLADTQDLSRAFHKEEHEQWQLPLEKAGELRARIRAVNEMRWILCTKIRHEGALGWEEVECDISKDMFEHLRMACKNGYRKTRYLFKVPDSALMWEFDVFKDSLGKPHPWLKMDLEVTSPEDAIPNFPIDISQVITAQPAQQNEDEKAFIDRLWNKEWVALDRHV